MLGDGLAFAGEDELGRSADVVHGAAEQFFRLAGAALACASLDDVELQGVAAGIEGDDQRHESYLLGSMPQGGLRAPSKQIPFGNDSQKSKDSSAVSV